MGFGYPVLGCAVVTMIDWWKIGSNLHSDSNRTCNSLKFLKYANTLKQLRDKFTKVTKTFADNFNFKMQE